MDGATIQTKIYAGYAKAAPHIGMPYDLYRPADPMAPLATRLATITASFNVGGSFRQPNRASNPLWQCIADGARLKPGDYLIGGSTFFIASMQPLLPIQAVECHRILSVHRLALPGGFGSLGYNRGIGPSEVLRLQGWPVSLLSGSRGGRSEVGPPGDTRQPGYQALMPAWPGIDIAPGDICTCDLGRRYSVSACELTGLGWRLTLEQAVT
jgi:hypothetical protein